MTHRTVFNSLVVLRSLLLAGVVSLLTILLPETVAAQGRTQPPPNLNGPTVYVIGRAQPGRNVLRWFPSSATVWQQANVYGYEVIRFTLVKEGQDSTSAAMLMNDITVDSVQYFLANRTVLGGGKAIKPPANAGWARYISKKTPYHAMVAEHTIKGSLEAQRAPTKTDTVSVNDHYGAALWGASFSFAAAQVAGIGFADSTVKKGEKYLYTVRTLIPAKALRVLEGHVLLTAGQVEPLPTVRDLGVLFADKRAGLLWNYLKLESTFNSYTVERSTDSIRYRQISSLPVTNLTAKVDSMTRYSDSLANNETTYYYRIRGSTIFQELSAPSNVVKGRGVPPLPPVRVVGTMIDTTRAKLVWTFPDSLNRKIKGFVIRRSMYVDSNYVEITKVLPVTQRTITVDSVYDATYYSVAVLNREGYAIPSFPTLVQLADSIPPAAPRGLTGEIDKAGVVRIKWNANRERDMQGYYVFMANDSVSAPVRRIKEFITQNNFVDSVNVKSLNRKIYYYVLAIDGRFNHSPYSQVLVLKRPNVTPPTQVAFTDYVVTDHKVTLKWGENIDEDLASTLLYRRSMPTSVTDSDTAWTVVADFKKRRVNTFADTTVLEKRIYIYALICVDEAGNQAEPTRPLVVETPFFVRKINIANFSATVDKTTKQIVLNWQAPNDPGIDKLYIFRQQKGDKLSVLRELSPTDTTLADRPDSENVSYRYVIRAMMKDGYYASTNELTVNYTIPK